MIRITNIRSLSAELLLRRRRRAVLNLHPLVDNQCCAAILHLQHKVQIPNCRLAGVGRLPNPLPGPVCNTLKIHDF
jgi:hypothetical protein